MRRTILHVDLDAFFAAAEQARRPSLRGRPVIVGRPEDRGVVAACSYEARAYGVRSAMPVAQARRLCPQAILIPPDFPYYRRLSRAFLAILVDYTPVMEAAGLDEAYLELTGCGPVAGSPERAATAIRRRVRQEIGLCASVGVAGSKVVAKVSSALAKPDGLLVTAPGREAEFLAPLPVAALPAIGPRADERLRSLGLTTCGDVARASPALLAFLFGAYGQALALRAQGIDGEPVRSAPSLPRSVSREVTFPRDIGQAGPLRAVLRIQVEKVGAELRRLSLRARHVTLKLRNGDFTTMTRRRTLPRPTDGDELLFEAAEGLLEEWLAHGAGPLRLIGVAVGGLVPGRQLALLEGRQERLETLGRTVDRLRARYGRSCLEVGLTRFSAAPAIR
ncbi:MAG TPA: DNA polymerase IV [Dehalococcoidia bacterium]|nr:DNA polymerase IV [Dehalococcoidia bacterium]